MTHSHPRSRLISRRLIALRTARKKTGLRSLPTMRSCMTLWGHHRMTPGEGFRGKERLEAFWDTMIGPSNTQIVSHQQIASGPNDCACIATATNTVSEDLAITIEMVVAYRVNNVGLITSLRAFWDQEAIAKQLGL